VPATLAYFTTVFVAAPLAVITALGKRLSALARKFWIFLKPRDDMAGEFWSLGGLEDNQDAPTQNLGKVSGTDCGAA
jgi:hypothetical protein